MLFWIAIWVFVAAPLALLIAVLIARMSGDELPKADPYSGALDPTLLDADAPRERPPAERPAPAQPTPHKTGESEFHFTSAPARHSVTGAAGSRWNRNNQH
jgi:hypothetical protein